MNILLAIDYGSGFTASPGEGIIILLILAGFVLLIFFSGFSSKKKKSSPQKYHRSHFRREAQKAGLNTNHIRFLESMIKKYKIASPLTLLSNQQKLDRFLLKSIEDIQKGSKETREKESLKLTIYRIKQVLERKNSISKVELSSQRLTPGQKITLSTDGKVRYLTRVNGNIKDFFTVDIPMDSMGKTIKWHRGFKLTAYLWGKEGKEFSFQTRCLGYSNLKTHSVLLLQHSGKILETKKRRFRRKELKTPVYFYPLKIITKNVGNREKKEAVVLKNQGRYGKVIDISAGGCCIRTNNPLPSGSLIKLDFETEKGIEVSLFGKILRVRKIINQQDAINHIMFTKGSSQNLNKVNAFIYELENSNNQIR